MNDICQSSAGNGSRDAEMNLRPRELEKLLSPDEAIIHLVSRNNFVLFTPMLHEVAASDLDNLDSCEPYSQDDST
jgi:hypothetical protein